jgi:hypothetical protein
MKSHSVRAEPKYAVCTDDGDTLCIDESTILAGGKGKRAFEDFTCGCCETMDELFCDNFPLDQPFCNFDSFPCDSPGDGDIFFCYNDVSKRGKKSSLKKGCGDPFTVPL